MSWLQKLFNKNSNNNQNKNEGINIIIEEKKIPPVEKEPVIKKEYILPPVGLIDNQESYLFKKGLISLNNDKLSFAMKHYGSDEYAKISITEMPNLLIGGTLMSGKSSLVNNILATILMRAKPDEVRLVLIDSKKIEFSIYNGLPHLLVPVISDPKRATMTLKRLVGEVERRYDIFKESTVRNIDDYNRYVDKLNEELPESEKIKNMPYILITIDEFTPITSVEAIDMIEHISSLGYPAGVHIVLVVNHPSANVISRLAQGNFLSRISFRTVSKQDSRMILDENGAEELEGKGTCLYKSIQNVKPVKLETPYISDMSLRVIIDYVCQQQKSMYDNSLLEEYKGCVEETDDDYEEPLYNEIVEFVVSTGKASASLLQRRFQLGYNRAARCIDLLEERGIIGPQNGSKPREVIKKD